MRPHLRYLKYVVLHKWFVFLAGLRTGVPIWRLVIHDWDKFLPRMWGPYVNNFYRDKPSPNMSSVGHFHDPEKAKAEFNKAWEGHWRRHGHHKSIPLREARSPVLAYLVDQSKPSLSPLSVLGSFHAATASPGC